MLLSFTREGGGDRRRVESVDSGCGRNKPTVKKRDDGRTGSQGRVTRSVGVAGSRSESYEVMKGGAGAGAAVERWVLSFPEKTVHGGLLSFTQPPGMATIVHHPVLRSGTIVPGCALLRTPSARRSYSRSVPSPQAREEEAFLSGAHH